jgi:uncharacterized membrane protein
MNMRTAREPSGTGARHGDHARGVNVSDSERLFSVLGGILLGLYGLGRIRLSGLFLAGLGGALVYRGVTGRCRIYRALGVNRGATITGEIRGNRGIKVERQVTVHAPADMLYGIWRNFENLPRFMSHLERVRVLDDRRSRWTVKTLAGVGAPTEWDAEIINERPGELIAWQSVGQASVDHAGSVRFERAGDGATVVHVELQYDPPAGQIGHAVASVFGQDAGSRIEADLREFKRAVEAGEITAGADGMRRHTS